MTPEETSSPNPAQETVTMLRQLLDTLYPADITHPDILTLDNVQFRYRLTGLLGPAATQAIEQSQRILRAVGNFNLIGLCEFHIGLIYLYSGECQGAAQRFAEARRQWSFSDDMASVCLAYFAEGCARHHSYQYETAMARYGKAGQWLPRIHLALPENRERFGETNRTTSSIDASRPTRSESLSQFIARMDRELSRMQARLRQEMWPPGEAASQPEIGDTQPDLQPAPAAGGATSGTAAPIPEMPVTTGGVPAPIVHWERPFSPIPDHRNMSDHYDWYEVVERKGDFLPTISEGSWLLVDRAIAQFNYEYEPGALLIIGANGIKDGSIVVRPHDQASPFSRIYLAHLPLTGPFIRDPQTGKVTLLTGQGSSDVLRDKILGLVVGLWLSEAVARP